MKQKKKLKLKPSARDKRRYFLIESDEPKKIESAILEYVGVLGMAKSAYMMVEKNNGKIIGSCLRESLNDVVASLAFKKLQVIKISGTLKGLRK